MTYIKTRAVAVCYRLAAHLIRPVGRPLVYSQLRLASEFVSGAYTRGLLERSAYAATAI